jgi:hypothetical protein
VFGIKRIHNRIEVWVNFDDEDREMRTIIEDYLKRQYKIQYPQWRSHLGPRDNANLIIGRDDEKNIGALHLGGFRAAIDKDGYLNVHDIGAILSVVDDEKIVKQIFEVVNGRIEWKHLDRADNIHTFKIASDVDDITEWIDKHRGAGKNILVHCKGGISRSVGIFIAYLMKSQNLTFEAAHQLVKEKRSCIKTKFGPQLIEYQASLKKPNYNSELL